MRVVQEREDAVTNAESTVMGVNAAQMSKLYFMISSTLYVDKFTSILRELCSNCRDSHNSAGKMDIPFTITAPTTLVPYLTVSDVGLGLTYAEAKQTILEFLGTTKDESDNDVGGFGIGAKSPRAYTSNYQIVMRKNGIEYVVQVFDKNGLPNEVLMLEYATTKPNGVDFVVPIEQKDITAWRSKVETYVANTNYNVEAFMGDGYVLRPAKPVSTIERDGYFVDYMSNGKTTAVSYGTTTSKLFVTYGGMRYTINSEFGFDSHIAEILNKTRTGLDISLRVENASVLKFGLSREHIEVEPKTKEFIGKMLLDILTNMRISSASPLELPAAVTSLAELQAVSDKVSAQIEAGTASLFGAYLRRAESQVSLNIAGLKRIGEDRLTSASSVKYNLPLGKEYSVPKAIVLYSKKNPTLDDWRSALSRSTYYYAIQYPHRTDNEAEVRAWIACLVRFEGMSLEYKEVTSTRGLRMNSGASGAIFAVCEETGSRTQIKDGKYYIMVKAMRYSWLGNIIGDCHFFVPTKAFLKREDVPDNVITYEEFVELDWVKKVIDRSLRRWEVLDYAETVYSAGKRLRENIGPESIRTEVGAIRTKIEALYASIETSSRTLEYANVPQDILATYDNSDIAVLLKEANYAIYRQNKYRDLFEVIDFKQLGHELERGNPEAKRLVTAMQLEQFYD